MCKSVEFFQDRKQESAPYPGLTDIWILVKKKKKNFHIIVLSTSVNIASRELSELVWG